jgi:hypothetical protein
MYIPVWLLVCLPLFVVWAFLAFSVPTSSAERARKRAVWQERWDGWAAARRARQAWRRRIFGSHPMLYGALFWLGPPVCIGVVAVIMGW